MEEEKQAGNNGGTRLLKGRCQPFNCPDCAEYYLLHQWKPGISIRPNLHRPRF